MFIIIKKCYYGKTHSSHRYVENISSFFLSFFLIKGQQNSFSVLKQFEIIKLEHWEFLILNWDYPELLIIKVCVCIQSQPWIKRKVKLSFKWYGLSSIDPPGCRGIPYSLTTDYMNTQYSFQNYFMWFFFKSHQISYLLLFIFNYFWLKVNVKYHDLLEKGLLQIFTTSMVSNQQLFSGFPPASYFCH